MRVVFFGSGSLALPSLKAVAGSAHQLALVATQPARPAGRGGAMRPTPVHELAAGLGLDVRECANVNAPEVVEQVGALKPDVICVVDFGQMVREPMRQTARHGALNMHASLLPVLRGAAPVNWAIIRGHGQTGVTTFRLVDAMDAGPIYLQHATAIEPHETAEHLRARLAELGAVAVCETLDGLAEGNLDAVEQDHAAETLAPKLRKRDGVIDFSEDATAICNRIHGTWPWPGGQAALTRGAGKAVPVILAEAEVVPGEQAGEAGVLDEDLLVQAGAGRVRIGSLKPAGKRQMDWKDFVNGYRVAAGDRFAPEDAADAT